MSFEGFMGFTAGAALLIGVYGGLKRLIRQKGSGTSGAPQDNTEPAPYLPDSPLPPDYVGTLLGVSLANVRGYSLALKLIDSALPPICANEAIFRQQGLSESVQFTGTYVERFFIEDYRKQFRFNQAWLEEFHRRFWIAYYASVLSQIKPLEPSQKRENLFCDHGYADLPLGFSRRDALTRYLKRSCDLCKGLEGASSEVSRGTSQARQALDQALFDEGEQMIGELFTLGKSLNTFVNPEGIRTGCERLKNEADKFEQTKLNLLTALTQEFDLAEILPEHAMQLNATNTPKNAA